MKTALFIKIGKAYYNQGFINIPIDGDEYFGKNGSIIQVKLKAGTSEVSVSCTINRTANNNGTPRLMMYVPFRDWVQSHFKMGDKLTVKILEKDSIVIAK